MTTWKMWAALICGALMALAVSGCGGPTLQANDNKVSGADWQGALYVGEFVDEHGAFMVDVNVVRSVRALGADGMTEVTLQVAHKEGTTLESLEAEFLAGGFTPVYLEPPNHWFDGMEYRWFDGVATFRVPKLEGAYARSTATYKFLVATKALSEQTGGLPLTVGFTLDGTEQTAHFEMTAPEQPAAIAVEGSGR